MADLIEIVVEADVSSLRDAEKALERFEKSSNKLGRTVLDVANKMKRVSSGWDEANKLYRQGVINSRALGAAQVELAREIAVLNNYVDANGRLNTRRALSELRAAEAARNAARANAEAADSARRLAQRQQELRMRFQEGYATFNRARQQMRDLREAMRQGIITTEQYRESVRRLREEQQRASAAAQGSTRGINGMGMVMQQTGYQVGDFLVQVQSGTNFMVAFGQQATQLVGILPLLGAGFMGLSMTSLVALSAGLGIAIPLLTAVGAGFMRTRGEGKTLSQTIQDLESSFGELNSSMNILKDEELDQTFGNMTDSIRSLAESMVELNNAAALTNLVSTLETLESSANAGFLRQVGEGFLNIGRFISPFAQGEGLFGTKGAEEVNEEQFEKLGFDMARSQYLAYLEEMQTLASAGNIEGVTALIDSFISDAMDNGAQLSLLGIQTAQSFSKVALSSAQVAAEMNGSAQAARDAAAAAEEQAKQAEIAEERRLQNKRLHAELAEREAALVQERNEGVQRILQAVETETQTLRDRAMLAAAETQYGRDSVEFRTLQATIEERIYREQLSQNGILGNNQERMVELRNSALRLEEGLAGSAKAAQDLASALQTANAFSQGLDQNVATLEARLAEAKGQQGAVLALTIQQMEAEAELNAMRLRAAGQEDRATFGLMIDRAQIERFKELNAEIEEYGNRSRTAGRKAEDALTDAEKAALDYAKALDGQVISAIDGISNAWGQFVVRGFNDFQGFVSAVLNSFKSMIANMIALAARNQIMLSLGIGGVGAGAAAGAVGSIGGVAGGSLLTGGGMLAGTGLGTALSGLSSGFMTSVYGGLAGTAGAVSGGLAAGGIGGISTAIGAIAAPLAAVAAVFSFFRKRTKELDSGIKITVDNMETLVQSFRTIQTSRFWGLSKKVSTTLDDVEAEVADPLIKAVGGIQKSVMDAAAAFGISASAFDDFFYEMNLSLKGLTEEQQIQKVNEELAKMGDEFASLTGHFETMNELLEAANQRMQLQNRLDQLLGNNAAILARQREAELAAMHELNRPLAQAIYQLEDAQSAVGNAFASLRVSIEAEKNTLRDAFTNIVEGLRERLNVATNAARRSQSVFDMLEGALSGRFVSQGMSNTFARREGALSFLRGGNFEDENRLEEALGVIGEPTEDLFSSFVDYARDFARTSFTIEEAKKVAQVQLTADEKQVLLLEEQISQAQVNLDAQLTALDEQLLAMERQFNALLGIDTSVKSVGAAIANLRSALGSLASAQSSANAAASGGVSGGTSGGTSGGSFREQFGTDEKFKGFDLAKLRGSSDLLAAAQMLGVQTSGRTGQQIQQAISNASQMAVSLDNATRVQQFAMGGFHTGGMRMVGERGPELEATGPSRIFSHNQTASMFRDPDLKDAVRSLKEEVAGLRSEQRQIQMDISKYTKRTYDIERKWDVDGLPATRA